MRPISTEHSPIQFPLSHLLGTAANVRLLRVLAEEVVGPISPPEAAERAGLTEAGARRALSRLSKTGLVRRIGGGRSHQYALHEDDSLVKQISLLFTKERERFDELISGFRNCFEGLTEVRHAWLEALPNEFGKPMEVTFVTDPESISWLREEIRRRVLRIEETFDLIVEVHGYTRADAPASSPEDSILLSGIPFNPSRPERGEVRTHTQREARALRLSRAIAGLLEKNPSLIRRAIRHLERILVDDQGPATHDLEEWKALLTSYSIERTREFLVADSSRAERLRQSSPFFAVLSPSERDQVLDLLETEA